jgi:hypothetical protein
MLERNCVRKILESSKTAYELFGDQKTKVIRDEDF